MIVVASAICFSLVWSLGVWLACKLPLSRFFMVLWLSSMNVCGSCNGSMQGGKLYVGVVV